MDIAQTESARHWMNWYDVTSGKEYAMKKGLVLVAVVGLVVFAGLIYGINMILDQSDDAVITCQVLEGDADAAEGISFRMCNQLQDELFWDSYITLHENAKDVEVHTVFEDKWEQRSDNVNYFSSSLYDDGIRIFMMGNYIMWNGGNIDFSAISNNSSVLVTKEEFEAASERTKPGETYTEKIQLNNLISHYDIHFEPNLSSGSYLVAGSNETAENFFDIQIPDSHMYKISITKDADGRIVQVGCGSESLAFQDCGVQTSDGLYFSFYGIKENELMDLTMGCGNGIFCIPLRPVTEENGSAYVPETTIFYNQIANVFPLPEKNCYPLEILTDEAEENLFLLTSENKKAVLRIIDKETMTEKQKLELMDFNGILGHNGYEQQMDLREKKLIIILSDNTFCYVDEENGVYEKRIVANLGEGPGMNREKLYDMVYQDGRLVLLIAKGQSFSSEAYLYIMSQKGVEYKGHFTTSFDYENGGFGGIYLREEEPLKILTTPKCR